MAANDSVSEETLDTFAKVLVLGLMTGDRKLIIAPLRDGSALANGFTISLSPIPDPEPPA